MGSEIERVAVVGAGVIGSGWAARFLGAGLDVDAWDPAPDARSKAFAAVVYGCGLRWPLMGASSPSISAAERGACATAASVRPGAQTAVDEARRARAHRRSDRQGRRRPRRSGRRPFDPRARGAARRFPCGTPCSGAEILARGGRPSGPAVRRLLIGSNRDVIASEAKQSRGRRTRKRLLD